MARKLKTLGMIVAGLVVLSAGFSAAFAETADPAAADTNGAFSGMLKPLVGSVIFGIVGLVILIIGYRVLDLATPFDLNKEIADDNNVAAGVLAAGMLVAVAIVIHAAMAL